MMDFLIDEIDVLEYLLEEEAEWEASLEAYLNSDPDYLEYKLKEEAFWDEYIKNSDSDDSDDQGKGSNQ